MTISKKDILMNISEILQLNERGKEKDSAING
jgi:hypothetical protein